VWDTQALHDVGPLLDAIKLASASITNLALVDAVFAVGEWTIASTGMSTPEEIAALVGQTRLNIQADDDGKVDTYRPCLPGLTLMHTVSAYPTPDYATQLRRIQTLRLRYGRHLDAVYPVGYSGHEIGLAHTFAAVGAGARVIERHVTLGHGMYGSDQPLSLDLDGFATLVQGVRAIDEGLGDGLLGFDGIERPARDKLRGTS
jgi:N-acetylneuraminate synthase